MTNQGHSKPVEARPILVDQLIECGVFASLGASDEVQRFAPLQVMLFRTLNW